MLTATSIINEKIFPEIFVTLNAYKENLKNPFNVNRKMAMLMSGKTQISFYITFMGYASRIGKKEELISHLSLINIK